MEATGRGVFPNKSTLPSAPKKRLSPSPQTLLPSTPPPQSPSSLPLDSFLLHLTATPSPPSAPVPRRHHPHNHHQHATPTPARSFLSPAAQALVLEVSSTPLPSLLAFLTSRRDELLHAADLPSLLKALELSGHWEWALALLRWARAELGAVDAAALEMVVRALGREGRHDSVCDLLDEMPLPPGGARLDVRAYNTVMHALSREGRYGRALDPCRLPTPPGAAPAMGCSSSAPGIVSSQRQAPKCQTLAAASRKMGKMALAGCGGEEPRAQVLTASAGAGSWDGSGEDPGRVGGVLRAGSEDR